MTLNIHSIIHTYAVKKKKETYFLHFINTPLLCFDSDITSKMSVLQGKRLNNSN